MPGDLDLDDVARLHRPRVRGRAREDHVAGLERDQPAEVGELVGDGEEEVVGRRLLHDLAVEVGAEREARSGRTASAGTSSGPSGRKPSWPLTRSIAPRSAWRKSCMPTSLAHV